MNVEIDKQWKVYVHYYDADKSCGVVKFIYTIGEIDTNRSIVFNINGNSYDRVYYKCLTGEINEADLLERVSSFKSKYVREKRVLQDGETFYEEKTSFTYYIDADKLIYEYAYFFTYDVGIINDSWGTIRIIDDNGKAIEIQR